jgi:hypothetical protein
MFLKDTIRLSLEHPFQKSSIISVQAVHRICTEHFSWYTSYTWYTAVEDFRDNKLSPVYLSVKPLLMLSMCGVFVRYDPYDRSKN